jgi:hypothetical protein
MLFTLRESGMPERVTRRRSTRDALTGLPNRDSRTRCEG